MHNWLSTSCVVLGCIAICSCAKDRKVTYEKADATGIRKYESDVRYVTDEQGNVKPNQDKRSRYDSEGSYAGGSKDYSGTEYKKGDYNAKRWGGGKGFNAKSYAGNKDGSEFKHSPHFVGQQAAAQGDYSSAGNKNYGAASYNNTVGSAATGAEVNRPQDSQSAAKRSSYQQPTIFTKEQGNGVTVEETNALLGR